MIKILKNNYKMLISAVFITLMFIFVAFITYNLAEPKAYDFMTRTFLTNKAPFDEKKQVYGSDDVVLIIIDSKSVERFRWPWKREKYCDIFKFLNEYAKPKVIVHDAIINTLDTDNPASDTKFFNTISKIDNLVEGFILSVSDWENPSFGEKYDKLFLKKYGVDVDNKTQNIEVLYRSLMQYPYPYLNVVKHAGSVLIIPGPISGDLSDFTMDEITRNNEYLIRYKDGFLPSIALKVFLLANNNPVLTLTKNHIIFPDLNYFIKIKQTYYQRINPIKYYKLYPDGYSHKNYSAIDIIDSYNNIRAGKKSIIDPQVFKDKIVVIGANVPAGAGLNDNKNSPVSVNHPGADIQATVIDNIMHKDFLKVLPDWVNIMGAILLIALLFFSIKLLNLVKSVLSAIILTFGYFTICSVCFYFGIIINVITPLVLAVITMILAYTYKYVIENKNKIKVQNAMGKYMSEDVMKSVIQNIDNLGLGGKKANVTVLFADIRSFTSMSEKMSAQQVSEILNEYFNEMEPIITKHNGVINKFIGDAIMAIFGEPIQDENHVKNAVKCGYEMLTRVEKLHRKWSREGKPEIEIGVGVNTGEVFVGNIGSVNRMEYTVIGDTVNLASRLENYNKVYKTKMLISPSVYKEVRMFTDAVKIPDVQIRGKANRMDIYEVLRVNEEKPEI